MNVFLRYFLYLDIAKFCRFDVNLPKYQEFGKVWKAPLNIVHVEGES